MTFGTDDLDNTVKMILDIQKPDGSIPWFFGGITDPWNHLEAVMGLNICGYRREAEYGLRYLFNTQLKDGSWWGEIYKTEMFLSNAQTFPPYKEDNIHHIRDTNFIAYIATAVWHHYLLHKDITFIKEAWSHVEPAIDLVISLQSSYGEINWIASDDNNSSEDALISGCSSIYKSLACAIKLAYIVHMPKKDWVQARQMLGNCLRTQTERFDRTWESNAHFSMDWYYPILCGVLPQKKALERLHQKWDTFVTEGYGCRCTMKEPWFTVAETAELIITLVSLEQYEKAKEMLSWLDRFKDENGNYWMGFQTEEKIFWPKEKTTWTAGSVILAIDAVFKKTPATHLFLPDIDLETYINH